MSTITYSGLTQEQKTFYEKALLKNFDQTNLFVKYGAKYTIPTHEGDTINWRRFNTPTLDAGRSGSYAITEGTTPTEGGITVTAVTATVGQYGNYLKVTDKLDFAGIDPIITNFAERLGVSANDAIDTVVREVVCAGTNVQFAGGRATINDITSSDKMTSSEIKKAVRTLKKKNAKPIEGGYFVMFVDPDVAYDLQADSLWQDTYKYTNAEPLMKGEIGKICGVKVIETTNLKVAANTGSVNVHHCVILGEEAYGVVDMMQGSKPEIIVHSANEAGVGGPLNLVSTIGWKACFAAKILNEYNMVRICCAVS